MGRDKMIDKISSNKKRKKITSVFTAIAGITAFILTVLGIIEFFVKPADRVAEIQREEFITNNQPQLELFYSAFHPGNRDPVLRGTVLDDTIGITGSYRLTNKGLAIITLERIDLPNIFKTRGYFTDRLVTPPYALSPNETLVISCELPGKERPIIETEEALKKIVTLICSYPALDVRYSYKFQWSEGRFVGAVRVIEE